MNTAGLESVLMPIQKEASTFIYRTKSTSSLVFLATLVLLIFLGLQPVLAQKFISKSSSVSFYSEAPLEDIEAFNTKATSIFDLSTGEIVFSVPIREFQFQKSLMKQHFNENYMDSEIYPKSTFKGKVTGYQLAEGQYKATATGELFIHGKTRKVQIAGNVIIGEEQVSLSSDFIVLLEDYEIKIPRILFSNIAESVEVNVEFIYKPYVTN